jgi:hypothetical protein
MEVLEYVRDSWLERAREAQGVKANERAVEVALKATLALQVSGAFLRTCPFGDTSLCTPRG